MAAQLSGGEVTPCRLGDAVGYVPGPMLLHGSSVTARPRGRHWRGSAWHGFRINLWVDNTSEALGAPKGDLRTVGTISHAGGWIGLIMVSAVGSSPRNRLGPSRLGRRVARCGR